MPPREGSERTAMSLASDVPTRLEVRSGRTPTRLTPVVVRGRHVSIEEHHRDYVRENWLESNDATKHGP